MKKTTDEFIQKLKNKGYFRDDLDWSEFVYINTHTKSIIIDSKYNIKHEMIPQNMLKRGVNLSIKSAINKEEWWIKRFIIKHDSKYTYSKFVYNGDRNYSTITCPTHGDFLQSPKSHLKGHGCSECYGNKKYTAESFLNKLKEIGHYHPEEIDYLKANPDGHNKPILLICKKYNTEHLIPMDSLFQIDARPFLRNAIDRNEYVLKQFKEIHGDKYEYSDNYETQKEESEIVCKIHGPFQQTPQKHKRGQGCYHCGIIKTIERLSGQSIDEYLDQMSDFIKYKRQIDIFTRKQPLNKLKDYDKKGRFGNSYWLDHMYSKKQGFLDNIPPYIIGNIINLEMLPWRKNNSKNTKCSITKEELFNKYYI